MAYEYIIHGIENKQFFYNAKKADAAVKLAERFTHHHEGALAPQRLKLELWQKAMLSAIFGIVDEDNLRQFREVVCVVGRKNGKTLLAASIAELMTYFDQEYGARTYFAAPKLEQASLCYDAFRQSIAHEPVLSAMTRQRRTDMYVAETNSLAKPLAFNFKKSDGLNCSCVIADEVAAWGGESGLKFYEVIKSSVGARKQPLILSISTAGYQNEGIYDELIKRSTRFLLGDSKERRLLPLIYQIDNVDKWNDINELKKANPNMKVSVSVDYLLEEIAIAEGSLSKKAEFITKYCNIKQNSSQAWLSTKTIQQTISDPINPEDFRGSYCVGGIDLSQTTDLTSACVVIEKDKKLFVHSHFWLPAQRLEEATAADNLPYSLFIQKGWLSTSGENFIDYHDCFNWFTQLVEQYNIYPLKVGYDRYSAQYLVQDMKAYGFHMDDVFQGWNLSPVIKETEGLMKDGTIQIGDNDLLKIHFLDSALKMNTELNKVQLVKCRKYGHIDGMAAFLDAMCVRQKWWEEIGEQLKNEE